MKVYFFFYPRAVLLLLLLGRNYRDPVHDRHGEKEGKKVFTLSLADALTIFPTTAVEHGLSIPAYPRHPHTDGRQIPLARTPHYVRHRFIVKYYR